MRHRRHLAAVIGTVMVLVSLAQGHAARSLSIGDAEEHLSVLESQIKRGEETAATFQHQLGDLAGEIVTQQGNLAEIQTNLAATNKRIWSTEAKLDKLRGQLKLRARALYKRGGALEMLGVLLGADSMHNFVDRVAYAKSVSSHDESLVTQTNTAQATLKNVQRYQVTLERNQADIVLNLKHQQETVNDVFAKQQIVLADLAKSRGELLDLLEHLAAKLGPGAIAAIRRVAGHGMTISYGDWAKAFLATLGAPVVHNNLVVVVAWEAAEGTQATWNPLATTLNDEGATEFNDSHVRNFLSKEQGIAASIRTLKRPGLGYEAILDGLERGADPMETAHAIQQSLWCHGCAEGGYVIGIVPAVEQFYADYAGGA